MGKDPAVLLYYADFLIGTALMTNEQVGAYVRILCHQADKGHLSMDGILTIIGVNSELIWKAIRDKFISDESGLLYNKRMDSEKKRRSFFCESRAQNLQKSRKAPHMGTHTGSRMEDEDEDRTRDRDINGNGNTPEGGKGETQNCELFQFWISLPNLAKHRTYTKDMQAASERIRAEYPAEDLKAAITALNEIVPQRENYLGVIPWTFDDFFRKGSPIKPAPFKKFLPENNPIESLKRRDFQTQRVKNEYEREAASKYDNM